MSLAVPYENVHDAQMRLNGSVVLYDNEPVYITDVREAGPGDPKGDILRIYASPLPYDGGRGGAANRAEEFRKFISSRKFDMAPFPMGFMNLRGEAYYCHRLPRRQQRQGLSENTFVGETSNGGRLNLAAVLSRQEFLDCIKGRYPSFEEAKRELNRAGVSSIAFARSLCLVRDTALPELVYLYHKMDKIGYVINNEIKLSKEGRCLRELLNESGVRSN